MRRIFLASLMASILITSSLSAADKIVIAHRGASGYLPEHTLEAKALAYGMGADYIEQDVVLTKDDHLIVLHDITLDRTTDVASQFPERIRDDGRFYAIDFSLEEIRTLNVSESFQIRDGEKVQGYENRFPMGSSSFRIPTFEEEIQLIQGLNKSTGGDIGIYPEIKQPEFHREAGRDISTAVINMLKRYGYTTKQDKVFLQTFSFSELEIIKQEILPQAGIDIKLVQLIDGGPSYAWMLEADGMNKLAIFADGIGPEKTLVIGRSSTQSELEITPLVERAHAAGLQVHPYTYRLDPGQVPSYASDFSDLLQKHYFEAGVDGLFTDFPDRAVKFLQPTR